MLSMLALSVIADYCAQSEVQKYKHCLLLQSTSKHECVRYNIFEKYFVPDYFKRQVHTEEKWYENLLFSNEP